MHSRWLVALLVVAALTIARPNSVVLARQRGTPPAAPAPAAQQGGGRGQQAPAASELSVLPVQGNVYMLVGAGGNIALQIGDDGVLLVDSGLAANVDKVVAKIREVAGDKPIRYIINTHVHPDHVGGNETIAKLGSTIAGGNVGAGAAVGAKVIAHENVLTRMSAPTGQQASMPFGAWPTDTYVNRQKELYFNGESIQIIHQPGAHTDGDSIVYFRKSDVICAGDIFVMTTYPIVDRMRGGDINGLIAGLNNMLDLAIPKFMQEGGTYIVPGHGRLTDEADLLEYRDMVTIIRDRVQDAIKRGQTLDQIKKANLTIDWDARWGATSGFWTTDMFLEAVYNDLNNPAKGEERKR
jgi:glyoxylase-like metal-dependent hydrolase (beta-lactamase superfamily II)